MEENQGWIKLYRKLLDNPIVCKDSDYFTIWCYLILNATHSKIDKMFNGNKITLKKGQLITGRKSISEKFNIVESKVQRVLKKLEIEQQIEQQTCTKNRLISILNWDIYQNSEQQIEQQVNNKRTTSEQQTNTNKNVKKEKNDNNDKKNIYGEYKHVLLTDTELQSLKSSYTNYQELIKYLDEYIEMKGYKAKSHYLCVKKWVADAVKRNITTDAKKDNNKMWQEIAEMNGEILE